jgi:hypothetical protein
MCSPQSTLECKRKANACYPLLLFRGGFGQREVEEQLTYQEIKK